MPKRKKIDNLRIEFQTKLKEQYIRGLSAGAKAIAGVVLQRATAQNSTAEEKLASIIAFCEPSLHIEDPKE